MVHVNPSAINPRDAIVYCGGGFGKGMFGFSAAEVVHSMGIPQDFDYNDVEIFLSAGVLSLYGNLIGFDTVRTMVHKSVGTRDVFAWIRPRGGPHLDLHYVKEKVFLPHSDALCLDTLQRGAKFYGGVVHEASKDFCLLSLDDVEDADDFFTRGVAVIANQGMFRDFVEVRGQRYADAAFLDPFALQAIGNTDRVLILSNYAWPPSPKRVTRLVERALMWQLRMRGKISQRDQELILGRYELIRDQFAELERRVAEGSAVVISPVNDRGEPIPTPAPVFTRNLGLIKKTSELGEMCARRMEADIARLFA